MNKYAVILGVILGVVTGALGLKALSGSSSTNIEMKIPGGGSLQLNAKKDFKDPATVLSALFAQDSSRQAAIDWLKSKEQMFAVSDPDLVSALQSLCPGKLPGGASEPFQARQARLSKCLDVPALKRLRYIAEHHRAPFEYIGQDVRIGIPANKSDQPDPNKASVCRNGDFANMEIELSDPVSKGSIQVTATGSYLCTGYTDYAQVQLNTAEAWDLFHRTVVGKYEKAVAVIIGD
jgi:hypothetical protein